MAGGCEWVQSTTTPGRGRDIRAAREDVLQEISQMVSEANCPSEPIVQSYHNAILAYVYVFIEFHRHVCASSRDTIEPRLWYLCQT